MMIAIVALYCWPGSLACGGNSHLQILHQAGEPRRAVVVPLGPPKSKPRQKARNILYPMKCYGRFQAAAVGENERRKSPE